jgi:hypothetical protein
MNASSQDILCDEFRQGLLTRKEFIELYLKNTVDHSFFVINNNSIKNIDDKNSFYGRLKCPENEV